MRAAIAVLVMLNLATWGLLIPSEAAASPAAACATRPPDYTGTDATVAQLVLQRQEAVDTCHALADRLDALDGDVRGGNDQAHGDAGGLSTAVGAATAAIQALPGTSSSPATVDVHSLPSGASSTVSLSQAAQDTINAGTAAVDGDLWFAMGLGAGLFAGGWFLRKMWF